MTQTTAHRTTTPTPWIMTTDPRATRARLAIFWIASLLLNSGCILLAHLMGY